MKRENQQDATNSMFIINLLSQHVSGIIMPIIRRIRPYPTACGVLPGCVGCGWLWSCGAASCTRARTRTRTRTHTHTHTRPCYRPQPQQSSSRPPTSHYPISSISILRDVLLSTVRHLQQNTLRI